ncbi:penicillin acylase family protein [Azospirillum sp. SYSU D00513]|uniref:penicillin acylase family protein n=1 Tax=Azospirillum sp. SYSU D00513 TaxID=2812561 RepID=UPI001A96EF6A|nr:penicillin acylase family protein [Azospirillum sp. SYSU D00513]
MLRRAAAVLALIVLLAVVLPLLAAGGFLLWLRHDQTPHSGSLALPGLQSPVEILRDAHAVPHIFAASEHDAYMALGYAHAQDRLWQMETMRRAGAGRLSELFGLRAGDWTLRLDRTMRTLGIYAQAEASFDVLPPEVQEAFTAYAAGVNGYLATRIEPLPIEFQILQHSPEPWRPADSLVWGKLMALQLSANYRDELLRARLLRTLSPEQVDELLPRDPPGSPVTLSASGRSGSPGRPGHKAFDFAGLDLDGILEALPDLGFDTASNEWALTGQRTRTGKPIIANDPHLGLEAPILWYLARIVTPDFTIAGATAPGVPVHLLGHNGRVAWGFTTTHSDTQDLFIERIDPQDPSRYLTPDGPKPFVTRTETIRIAGQPDETLTVRETRHGPVLTPLEGADATPEGHVLALAFPGLSPKDTSAAALYRLNHAADAEAAREALFLHVAPQQNIVYADVGGRLGFMAPALVPVRAAGDGRVPVPGWTGEYDWTGYLPFEALPQAIDPPSGQFVNANNAVVGPDYPHFLGADWPDPSRARRIVEMLGDKRHSVEDVLAQQMDIVSPAARDLLPLMLKVPVRDGLAAEAVGQLRDWDGRMRRDRPEPLIFNWWLRELVRTLYADELGDAFPRYWDLRPRAVHRALTDSRHWCDDLTTAAAESCADALSSSLKAALSRLQERHGPQLVAWRWGNEHKAALQHRILGRLPVLDQLFDLSIETDGGIFTVNRGTSPVRDPESPFAHVHGSGLRAVYDLADLSNSRFIIATGQSGNPLSPHWGDLVRMWRDGGTLRLAGDRGTLASAGASILTLSPASEKAP